MKKAYLLFGLLVIAGMIAAVAMAAPPASVNFHFTDVPTNAAGTVLLYPTNETWGFVNDIEVRLLTTGTTVSVAVVVYSNGLGGVEHTLLSLSGVSASGIYRPRFPVHTSAGVAVPGSTNELERFLLVHDRIRATASLANSNSAGVDVSVEIHLDKP